MMPTDRPRDLYDKPFFDAQVSGALESARIIVPLVRHLIQPQTIVDLGCGRGAWLRAFMDVGASSVAGFDGDYVGRDALLIPPECFVPADLSELTRLPGRYDLAICLEVLEHLPPQAGCNLVAALTEAAPVILFSAAIPGQGGTNHVNEQWPEYWARLFAARGFRALDLIRPRIRDDTRIVWWYRQNILMFASEVAISANETLKAEPARQPQPELEWVHVSLVRKDHARNIILSTISRALPVRLKKRLKQPLKAALAFAHLR